MFIPVRLTFGAGEHQSALYDRQIDLTGRQLAAFEHEAGDLTVPLAAVGKDLRTGIEAAFATQGGTGATGPWAELSEDYGAWKAKQSPGTPLLVGLRPLNKGTRSDPTVPESYKVSGEMRLQLLDPAAMFVSPRRLLYAPLSDIAGWHETGTENMPARPPVDVSLPFLHSVDRAFARWLAGVMKKVGL